MEGDVSLVISQNGKPIREYKNTPASEGRTPDQGMRAPRGRSAGNKALESTKGMHRFVWDMRVDGPEDENGKKTRGPLAVPGSYSASLQVGDWTADQPIDLLIDPLVEAEGIGIDDLIAQHEFNWKMAELSAEARALTSKVKALLENVPSEAEIKEKGNRDRRRRLPDVSNSPTDELNYVLSQLETDNSDSYPPPMLLSQIGYLGSMTSSADQRPGNEAYVRFDELRRELTMLSDRAQIAEQAIHEAQNKE